MIVVAATTEEEVSAVYAQLAELGAQPAALPVTVTVAVAAPGGWPRLVRASVEDDGAAEQVVAALRRRGFVAVARPDGGARLDAWVQHTAPVVFDDRLSISFVWSEHPRPATARRIELGLGGFGNGAHPTTRMIIAELLRGVKGGERVLDVGCGSGVLGLCALAAGAAQVVAVDIETEAIEATRRNALLNGVSDRLAVRHGPLDAGAGTFDIVVANIGRAGLVGLAPELTGQVRPGGWLAASGFSPNQCGLVAGFLKPLVERDRHVEGEWATVVLVQPTAGADQHNTLRP